MALHFDPDSHTYTLDGKVLPSVTQILRPLEADALARIPAGVLEWKRALGSAVHLACELDDKNELDADSLDDRIRPYLEGWRAFRHEHGLQILCNEQPMATRFGRFAGTVDRYGLLHDGGRIGAAVIDIKTRVDLPDAIGPQLVGYARLLRDNGLCKDEPLRMAVQLKPDGTYATRIYEDKEDVAVFQACLSLHHWMTKRL